MDWKWFYTSLDGRIGRKQFWIGAILLGIAGLIVGYIIMAIFGVGMMNFISAANSDTSTADMMALMTRSAWANLVVYLLMLYPAAAMMIKRRHDRGNSGLDVWIYLGIAVLMILVQALGVGYAVSEVAGIEMVTPSGWMSIIGALVGIFALYLLVVCGFLKGNEGDNAYGADPLA